MTGNLVVLTVLGLGGGTFGPSRSTFCPGAQTVKVADFNGDGRPHVAVANFGNIFILQVSYADLFNPGSNTSLDRSRGMGTIRNDD